MAGRLSGKTALVLGAGSIGPGWGNGRAIAARFAQEGARVTGVDRARDALIETSAALAELGGEMTSLVVDVTDPGQLDQLFKRVTRGDTKLDILVNNVGGSAPGTVVTQDSDAWHRQFAINTHYVFETLKRAIPIMAAQDGGAIVNIASIAGHRSHGPDSIGYSAAKAALLQLSRVSAVHYAAQGVRINTVSPGYMDTPLVDARLAPNQSGGDASALRDARARTVPMARMGDGWDVANAALFLASDEARYITGADLLVDGGIVQTCVTRDWTPMATTVETPNNQQATTGVTP